MSHNNRHQCSCGWQWQDQTMAKDENWVSDQEGILLNRINKMMQEHNEKCFDLKAQISKLSRLFLDAKAELRGAND